MSVILSLQGCMAVGKTTALKYIETNLPNVYVSYENPVPMLEEIKKNKWDKDSFEGFLNIQRLFITAEIERYLKCRQYENVLIDLGADEIEFYTLFYPKSMGYEWNIEEILADELAELRKCKLSGVLFLIADPIKLRNHKESDNTRCRGSFDFYLNNLYPEKLIWFSKRTDPVTHFLTIDGMSPSQVGQRVSEWINNFINTPSHI